MCDSNLIKLIQNVNQPLTSCSSSNCLLYAKNSHVLLTKPNDRFIAEMLPQNM